MHDDMFISNGQTRPVGNITKTETPNVSSQCLSDMLGVNIVKWS
jgi:hypothetical protein